MSSNPDIWMPFYMGDFKAATASLTHEEKWAYLEVMWEYWRKGHKGEKIKFDKKIIKNIAQISLKKVENILAFFENREGNLYHARIEKEISITRRNKELQCNRTANATAARIAKRRADKQENNTPPTNVTSNVPFTPSPSPDGYNNNLHHSNPRVIEGDFRKKNFDIDLYLSDDDRGIENIHAPRWDKHALRIKYNNWIKQPGQVIPDHPVKAYLGWVKNNKKGLPPK